MVTINKIEERIYRSLRGRYKQFYGINTRDFKSHALVNLRGQDVSDIISEAIRKKNPFMLSRFGSVEIGWYVQYKLLSMSYTSRVLSFIKCKTSTWQQTGRIIDNMTFVPKSINATEAFIDTMDMAIPQIDLLGSWLKLEQSVHVKLSDYAKFAYLLDIEPYYHKTPWSESLAGKKVLVIHPMVKSIEQQYNKRTMLFENRNLLPEFELITLQAKYFDDPVYDTWLKIYLFYLEEIYKMDFDVAIIGCGSWGMPVAAQIKKMGKIAIHLGGATQLLFGIIGTRWETLYPGFKERFVNEHWVRPMHEETPGWAKNYENNTYW
jgi:hypothetical protein